ncbi:MAG: diguanylate cyclase [Coriobacteriales bacterium]|nr:diguanylate cyclase [Coriobacteriales bacterium]
MRISLRVKTNLLIALAAILVSVAAVVCYNNATQEFVVDLYSERATDLARTVSVSVDSDRVRRIRDSVLAIYDTLDNKVSNDSLGTPELDAYTLQFDDIAQTEDYRILVEQVREIQDQNNSECVYIVWPHQGDSVVLYIADGSYEDQCLPGQFDHFTEHDHEVFENPDAGIPADVTHTIWGWVVAVGMPIYDNGEIVGYATDDFSMDDIMARQNSLLLTVIAVIALITLLLAAVALYFVNRFILAPVRILTDASMSFMNEGVDLSRKRFANLPIHTHDEMETLADAMEQMENEIDKYVQNLKATTTELAITRERARAMNEMASRDAMTHTLNKRAYSMKAEHLDARIARARQNGSPMPAFGIAMVDLNFLKRINDTFGHEAGDAAILALVDAIRASFVDCPAYRIGGDEFAILLRGAQCAEAEKLEAQLKEYLNEHPQKFGEEPWAQVSAAVGHAIFDEREDEDTGAVLRRADKSMYADKASMKAVRE